MVQNWGTLSQMRHHLYHKHGTPCKLGARHGPLNHANHASTNPLMGGRAQYAYDKLYRYLGQEVPDVANADMMPEVIMTTPFSQ